MSNATLLFIWFILTLLASIVGYFILVEVVVFVRDLSGRRQTALQTRDVAVRVSRDTGPLSSPKADYIGPPAEASPPPEAIRPLRDPKVVRQLIDHFSEEDPSIEPGSEEDQ